MSSSTNDSPRDFADRFRVESRLGRGGMGDVYKAYDTVLERTVAVKTLTPGNAGAQAVERLLREARACARLTHPGIVTIHDVLQVDGSVHIVMEHLEGTSLESLHRFPRFSTLDAKIDLIIRILDALHYAHGRGVVHRDIKPTNVQLLPDGSLKLLDFGIAHIAGASALTVTGTMTGSAHYASPEQLRGEESDASTDIYSTGILAYEVLTRRRPFDGDSLATVLTKVLHDPLPAMETSFSENFPDIERIIQRATAKRGQERYGSAEDMKNALAAFLASSREAIVTKQAEVAATTQRFIIEAKSLISGGRTAEAIPLLTSVLRSNPDAEEARELLRTSDGASREATGASIAPHAGPESTIPPDPDEPTSMFTSAAETAAAQPPAATAMAINPAAETATAVHADTDSSAPEASSLWSGYRRLAAVPVLIVLAGVILLGLNWMSPASPDDALSAAAVPSLEPEPEPVQASVGTPGSSLSGSSLSESSVSESAEEAAGVGPESADGAKAVSLPAAVASPPAPAPTAATPVRPSPPPEAPAVPVPALAAKDLYYATTRPGPASSAGTEATPASVGSDGAVKAGIRYRILRREPNGDAREVAADTLFRSGDRIRFAFEPNIDGFLYVLQRGSTGRWCLLLPHPQINSGQNYVTRFGEVSIPPEGVGWFRFDENPGSETLFVYLSREPIATLPWGGGPVANVECVDQPTVIELANSVRTRDLVFEKEDTAGGADQAAYVVNQDEVGHAVAWTVELRHR